MVPRVNEILNQTDSFSSHSIPRITFDNVGYIYGKIDKDFIKLAITKIAYPIIISLDSCKELGLIKYHP